MGITKRLIEELGKDEAREWVRLLFASHRRKEDLSDSARKWLKPSKQEERRER